MIDKKYLVLVFLINCSFFFSSCLIAQESLTPLKFNGELIKNQQERSFNRGGCNNLFLKYDTLSLEDFAGGFMDDFTSKSILANHFPTSTVKDTLLFQLLNDKTPFGDTTFVNDTTYHIKINITPTDTTIDSIPFPAITITVNHLDTCPIITESVEAWPSYNILDTVSTGSPDTIFADEPNFVQDSLKTYIVWADAATRWIYGSVFVNPSMGVNPPTIQVATFDGLDSDGIPYDFNEMAFGLADSLVSLPINLEKNPADSIYLSFYFQAGGLGNQPEKSDSLTLHFYSPIEKKWFPVWKMEGIKMDSFKQKLIPITDPKFLQNGFQFRFRNYGSLSGSLDHWHIDYIKLDQGRLANDSIHDDLAFTQPLNTLLKEYTAMPWIHFRTNPSAYMLNDTTLTYHSNLSTNRPTLNLNVFVNRQGENLKKISINPHPQSKPLAHFPIPINELWEAPNNFVYPINLDDTCATFDVEIAANPNGEETSVNRYNDTIKLKQVFKNYYAYDDGTPEAGYHINTTGGGGLLAYKFSLGTIKDTLAGVFFYFNPVAINASFEKFWLTIWDATGPGGKPGNIIYQNTKLSQPHYGRIGRFQYEEFEELIGLTGDFYVGFKQLTEKHINVGYDKNMNAKTKIFFNTSGKKEDWLASSFDGSLMIRPAFKFHKKVEISTDEHPKNNINIKAYPIPSTGFIQLIGIENLFSPNTSVYDIRGKMVWNKYGFTKEIDLSGLENGIYLLKISDTKLGYNSIQKIIISKGG